MGQKSNPNSFQLKKHKTVVFSSTNNTEYASIFRDQNKVLSNFIFLFEKNKCFVKSCFFVLNNEKMFITFFISFLIWKKRTRHIKSSKAMRKTKTIKSLIYYFYLILSNFGYVSSKRLIFQNLNKVAATYQKKIFFKEHLKIKNKLQLFRHEPYFNPGLSLFCLMNTTKNTSVLLSKFIAKFFKMFHRTRKINKFLRFLALFVENITLDSRKKTYIKGLKIQIKGRFKGVSRSKVRIFKKGQVPLQTFKCNIEYSLMHIHTSYGVFGIKVWVFE